LTTIAVLVAIATIPPTRPARVSTWKIPSQVERRHQDSRRACQQENPRPRFRHRQAIGESDENELVVLRAEAAPLSAGIVVVVDDQQGLCINDECRSLSRSLLFDVSGPLWQDGHPIPEALFALCQGRQRVEPVAMAAGRLRGEHRRKALKLAPLLEGFALSMHQHPGAFKNKAGSEPVEATTVIGVFRFGIWCSSAAQAEVRSCTMKEARMPRRFRCSSWDQRVTGTASRRLIAQRSRCPALSQREAGIS